MMSFAEAINFINPAYNPNVESYFPQPLLTSPQCVSDSSVASTGRSPGCEGVNESKRKQLLHVVPLKKNGSETVQCEICSISCNSKRVFDDHILGKRHLKKAKEQKLDTSMLDLGNTAYTEGAETKSFKNVDIEALPGLNATTGICFVTHAMPMSYQHVTGKEHTLGVESNDCDAIMLEPSRNCSPDATEIQILKHQESSLSVVGDESCNRNECDDKALIAKRTLNVVLTEKSSERLQCEICNILCNSKKVLDNHILGRKHRNKAKEQNLDASMLDHVNAEYTEGAETKSVKYIDNGSLPCLDVPSGNCFGIQAMSYQDVPGKEHTLVVESRDQDTIMLEPSTRPDVSKIQTHQESRSSVADDSCNNKQGDDEAPANKRLSNQSKAEYSASNAYRVETNLAYDLTQMNYSSRTSGRAMGKHLAGKPHARKVKKLGTMVSSPASGCAEIDKNNNSEGGNISFSSNLCTICNINCNSQEILLGHLSGKKHASKVRRLGPDPQTPYLDMKDRVASKKLQIVQLLDHVPVPNASSDDASSIKQVVLQDDNPLEKSVLSVNTCSALTTIPAISPKGDSSITQLYISSPSIGADEPALQYYKSEATQRAPKRGKIVQFAYCDVCKVYCNSSEILNAHLTGKKHTKQLEKLANLVKGVEALAKDMILPGAVDSIDHQDASNSNMVVVNQVEAPKGIINTHNHNNVQTTSQDPLFGCTLCKVVCNGQMTLTTHLAGKRHATMLQKTGTSEIADPAPPAAVSN